MNGIHYIFTNIIKIISPILWLGLLGFLEFNDIFITYYCIFNVLYSFYNYAHDLPNIIAILILIESFNMKALNNEFHNDYDFVYEVKKNAYKKYVEECWGSWIEEDQRNYFKDFIVQVKENAYIIQLNGKDIGFYNGETLEDGSYEIGNICIIPEYQGRGIGTEIDCSDRTACCWVELETDCLLSDSAGKVGFESPIYTGMTGKLEYAILLVLVVEFCRLLGESTLVWDCVRGRAYG